MCIGLYQDCDDIIDDNEMENMLQLRFDPLATEKYYFKLRLIIFRHILCVFTQYFMCRCLRMNATRPHWLTHWGRVTHICVNQLTIIGSDNGLLPDRRQAIIWTNAGILLIGPLGTNFSEILIEILTFSFKKMRLKVSSAKRRPFCLGLNVLKVNSASSNLGLSANKPNDYSKQL